MRIHLTLSKNTEIIPFDYQQLLTGVIHKWLGEDNTEHDAMSLYSFSWLKNGKAEKNGIHFRNGAQWFISTFDDELLRRIITAIQKDPVLFYGLKVLEITIQETPDFNFEERFVTASPVFIKRRENDRTKYYYYDEPEADKMLTETLANKLSKAGLNAEGLSVAFDKAYSNPAKKGTTYKGIKSIGSVCPVIIKGTPEQIAFAWNVGLGNSTGIGFGALN